MTGILRHRRWALLAMVALLASAWAIAQGQSPTSPRPRPDIPDNSTDPVDGASGAPTNSRFGEGGPRFGPDTTSDEGVKNPPIRRATRRESRDSGSTPIRAVTGGKVHNAPPATGLIMGNGAAIPPANATNPPAGQELNVVGNDNAARFLRNTNRFDAILQREVTYAPLPEGGEAIMEVIGPMSVSEFMQDIRIATMWNVLISDAVKDKILDFAITKATPQQAMEILKFHDLYYEYDPATEYLYVMSIEEWQEREFGDLTQHTFALEHTDGEYLQTLLLPLLSSRGRIILDSRTRRIHVWDSVDNIELMEATVAEADVPMGKREFKVDFADFADIQAAMISMLSANGSLLPDSRTSTIIVWDQPDVLTRMEEALGTIDVPVASRTFYLQHVHAEDMLDHLEVMISERGVIQIDPRYNAIIVSDLPGKLDRIEEVLQALDQELESRTWVIDYADLDFIAEQIESRIPPEMGEIIVHEEVHQITVKGIPSRLDEIEALIKVWDIQRKQVQIEAFIVEVGSDVEREFNINWSYFGSSDGRPIFADGGTGFQPDGGNLNVGQLPYTVPLYGALELDGAGQIVRPLVTNTAGENVVSRVAGNNLAVTLDYLDQKNKATVLSSPRVAVQDGEEASFDHATEVPFISSTTFFSNGGLNNFGNTNNTNRVEFINVGTILRVLPRITTKDNILLDISAEDSTFVEVRVLASDQQSTIPQKTVRRAETQLRIQSGDTVVLGGLRRDRSGQTENRTPLLGDLPGIGRLFRYPNRQSEKNTLLIFITPTIVDEFTDPAAEILARAEETIAESHRHNQKSLWGRLAASVSRQKNELSIAVGQSGDIHAEGERATLPELETLFAEAPAQVGVVLRAHPRAPDRIVAAITELALDADRKLELDKDLIPLIPRYRPSPAESPEPTTIEASTPLEP